MDSPLFVQNYPRGSKQFIDLVNKQAEDALIEDIGSGDLTASLLLNQQTTATIVSRDRAIICGIDWANACFQLLDPNIEIVWHIQEGEQVSQNQTLSHIKGNARALVSAERCALNFLQTLSAVATHTQQYVELIQGTKVKILDTRKTIPGLRLAQKYAVTVGGGFNQRLALYDGILIKENHIAAAGSITAALQQASALNANTSIQIEVESLAELIEALAAGATSILLDDFNLSELREAVKITQNNALLEASGSVSLSSVRQIAETGIDRISIGALTKNIQAIDLSMRIK